MTQNSNAACTHGTNGDNGAGGNRPVRRWLCLLLVATGAAGGATNEPLSELDGLPPPMALPANPSTPPEPTVSPPANAQRRQPAGSRAAQGQPSDAPIAVPLPLPEWTAPGPSGIVVEAEELPQTPAPSVPVLPDIAPIPEIPPPPYVSDARDDAQLPRQAAEDLPAALTPAIDASPVVVRARLIDSSVATTGEALAATARRVNAVAAASEAAGASKTTRFVVRGNRSLPVDIIKAVLGPFVPTGNVRAAREALQQTYVRAGRPFVRVVALLVPARDDVVVLEIAEPRLRSLQLLSGVPDDAAAPAQAFEPALDRTPNLRMTRGLRVIR